MSIFADAHAHVNAPEFEADRHAVLARARAGGVAVILDVALSGPEPTFERALALAEAHDGIYLALGVHPHDAKTYTADLEERLLALSAHPKVIAWGEIGLDYHYDHSPRPVQREVFRRQLQVAERRGLPVIIHSREAEADTLALLQEHGPRVRGMMHCFTGSLEMARRCVELGLYISFSGIITFRNASALVEVVRALPRERILIETDCPYLAPVPYRGKRNEPLFVREVARRLADVWGESLEAVARQTTENFLALFADRLQPRDVRRLRGDGAF
ncbi:MAG: TatD family hydrolase [Acidobacteriota bacterium]|nr:TatD family hydrolase [Acidobacteriota bacterium]